MARARDVALDADTPFAEAAARVLEVRAAELWEQSGGVLDTSDIERVHDMRVASRRLRAVLEIFAPAFPRTEYEKVLREVKALADALGARRDPDVQLEALAGAEARMPKLERGGFARLEKRIRKEQQAGNRTLEAALRHAAEERLEERLDRLVTAARDRAAT